MELKSFSLKNFKIKPIHVILLSILLLFIDQLSKILVKTSMTINEAIYVFGEWFQIRFVENPGAAFGMELGGDYGKLILSLFRIVAVVALIWYIAKLLKRENTPKGVIIGFTMIMVGALGNIIDSAFYGLIFTQSTYDTVATFTSMGEGYAPFLHGKVVDMLYFPIINVEQMPEWMPFVGGKPFTFFSPIFNIADSYITIALFYLIIFKNKFFAGKTESSKTK